MTKAPTRTATPASRTDDDRKIWSPPANDEEFVFESIDKAPAWVDRGWAGFDRGPALQLPAGDLYNLTGPYHTMVARVGDKVVYTAAKGSTPPKFTVIPGEPDPESGQGTRKMPQVTNASLEDMLKTGYMTPDDLGTDAQDQVAMRSPGLQRVIEGKAPAPDEQSIKDTVKLD